jgi:hypothetical protein
MTSTALKVLALVFMFIDHLGEFIPGIPEVFRWIGRISAPLFFFTMVWGFFYTHDRKKYLIRMYLFGLGMAAMDLSLNFLFTDAYSQLRNNIFVTLLLSGLIVAIIEKFMANKKEGIKWLILFLLLQMVSTILCFAANKYIGLPNIDLAVGAVLPNVLFNEGSYDFVMLGVLLYFVRKKKSSLAIGYITFCIAELIWAALAFWVATGGEVTSEMLFLNNYQWVMIFALPFMLMYNGKKGKGMKYLFYIFYPGHIVILFLIGNLLF